MQQYYDHIYSHNKTRAKQPAPKNFWPYNYEFYMCLPLLTFSAIIEDIYTAIASDIIIEKYVDPTTDRTTIQPELMPKSICDKKFSEGYYSPEEILEMPLRPVRLRVPIKA